MTGPVTRAYFVDDKGNERDIREIDQVIQDVYFPKPTPEQAEAFAEFYKSMEEVPVKEGYKIEIPDE